MTTTPDPTAASPLDDPRVHTDRYLVRPSGYDDMVHSDRAFWCLSVVDGHQWGWSVRRGSADSPYAMNRKGEWVLESRGSARNKARRWPLEEALGLALKHVDTLTLNGHTAAQASAEVAARLAERQEKVDTP